MVFHVKEMRESKKDDAIHCIFSLVKFPILLQSSEVCLLVLSWDNIRVWYKRISLFAYVVISRTW